MRVFLLTALLVFPCMAQFGDLGLGLGFKRGHTQVALIAERAETAPGDSFLVGIKLTMDPHWHTYWQNPGKVGKPTTVSWTLPEGVTAGPIQWPVPQRLESGGFVSYAYETEAILLVELTVADSFASDSVRIAGAVSWLECKEACVPGKQTVSLTIPLGRQTQNGPGAASLAVAKSALPHPIAATAERNGDKLTIRLPVAGKTAMVMPVSTEMLDDKAPQTLGAGETLTVTVQLAAEAKGNLAAVVATDAGAYQISVPTDAAKPGGSLWTFLVGAFLGGLLLNLMPCVLPVISIKVMGLVESAGQSRGRAVSHGLAFGAGVLLSFWLVAGLLLVLRAGGSGLGWGFQMQNPLFVLGVAVLLTLVALNFLGVFELGSSLTSVDGPKRSGLAGSFASGVLATVVATPCTAPFMGGAIVAALSAGGAQAMLIFTGLGLGMAMPMMLLTAFPVLVKFLPKPGAWMERLKQFLAFPLLFTVVWLVGLFGQLQASDGQRMGVSGAVALLAGLVLLGLAAWLYGACVTFVASTSQKWFGRIAGFLLLLAAVAVPYQAIDRGEPWQAYSDERIAALEADQKAYFIDFTAEWCLTCQVNKAVALNRAAVTEAFRKHNIATVRADWTNPSDEISAALARYGRASVPLYVLKVPGKEPELLPNTLTPGLVIGRIEAARTD